MQHIHDTQPPVRGPQHIAAIHVSCSGMTTPLPCAVRPQDLGSAPYEADLESDGVRQAEAEAGRQEETEGPGQGRLLLLLLLFSPPTPHAEAQMGRSWRLRSPLASVGERARLSAELRHGRPGLAAVACAVAPGAAALGTHPTVPHMESCAPSAPGCQPDGESGSGIE